MTPREHIHREAEEQRALLENRQRFGLLAQIVEPAQPQAPRWSGMPQAEYEAYCQEQDRNNREEDENLHKA
jgi:hypothetical protein